MKIIITENYNPERSSKYIWEIRSNLNDIEMVGKLFKKYDSMDEGLAMSMDAFRWDEEKKIYHTNFNSRGVREIDYVMGLNLEAYDDDIFVNQFEQYANMHRFFCGRVKSCPMKRMIQSDGSHARHGVDHFDINGFMLQYVDKEEIVSCCNK